MVQNYKTSWNSSNFIDIYNILIYLHTKDDILCQQWIPSDFLIFNRSRTRALHRTPPMLLSVETREIN